MREELSTNTPTQPPFAGERTASSIGAQSESSDGNIVPDGSAAWRKLWELIASRVFESTKVDPATNDKEGSDDNVKNQNSENQ